MGMRTVVWFRGKDLRVTDHAPLAEAIARGGEVVPIFVLDPYFFAPERAQGLPHRMQFLLESIAALRERLQALGSDLLLFEGKATTLVPHIAKTLKANAVLAQRWVEPFGRKRDERIGDAVRLELFEGEMLRSPSEVRTASGSVHTVFSPFCRAFYKLGQLSPAIPAPKTLPPIPAAVRSALSEAQLPTLAQLGITENPRIQRGGENLAHARLESFLRGPLSAYETGRDLLAAPGTSRLSQDLKFGTLSPRFVFEAVRRMPASSSQTRYLNELIWREFAYLTLRYRPEVLTEPFRPAFAPFPWRSSDADYMAWELGKTGYPVVDASARQLLEEGFVHNRARMISASFFAKHLMLHYKQGEAHYLKYLTDGDWAQNNMGWQWSAGCGCDAQPYFRVFNPVTQGEKFDPEGTYVRRYVPELRTLDAKYIHKPWEAPPDVLRRAGVSLGTTYPRPIVDHKFARDRFLATAKRVFGKDGVPTTATERAESESAQTSLFGSSSPE